MNIEEVEEPKKYVNLQTKPVLDPFKSTAEHRKVRELPRKMNIEEVEEPETTKIYRQNPRPTGRPPRKLRKFTDETNMQARNHENSDEFCTEPRPPPRSSHPGAPSVTTLFGEKQQTWNLKITPKNSNILVMPNFNKLAPAGEWACISKKAKNWLGDGFLNHKIPQ